MRRRSLFKSIGAFVAGMSLPAVTEASAGGPRIKACPGSEKPRQKQFVEAPDGTSLFFRACGKGRPMLFVAPWALNSNWWEYQMADLSERGIRCVGYDRRGHGHSDEPSHGYDFDALADDLASVIEQLALREIILVGQSLGCSEVVRYLSRHGAKRVAHVVMVATITPFVLKTEDNPEGVDRAALENVRRTLSKDRPGPIAAAAPAFFGAPKDTVSKGMMDWWARMMVDQCSLRVMLELHRMFTETDFRPELRKITVPTLLIHGDSDTSAPLETTGRRTAALIAGSQLKVYEGAGHGLPITHAEPLNADLLAVAKSS